MTEQNRTGHEGDERAGGVGDPEHAPAWGPPLAAELGTMAEVAARRMVAPRAPAGSPACERCMKVLGYPGPGCEYCEELHDLKRAAKPCTTSLSSSPDASSRADGPLGTSRDGVVENLAANPFLTPGRRVLVKRTRKAGRLVRHFSGGGTLVAIEETNEVHDVLPYDHSELLPLTESGFEVIGVTSDGGPVIRGPRVAPDLEPSIASVHALLVAERRANPVLVIDGEAASSLDDAAQDLELAAELLVEQWGTTQEPHGTSDGDHVDDAKEKIDRLRDLEVTLSDAGIAARIAARKARHGKPAAQLMSLRLLAALSELSDVTTEIDAHMAAHPEWWENKSADHGAPAGVAWAALCERQQRNLGELKVLARNITKGVAT